MRNLCQLDRIILELQSIEKYAIPYILLNILK